MAWALALAPCSGAAPTPACPAAGCTQAWMLHGRLGSVRSGPRGLGSRVEPQMPRHAALACIARQHLLLPAVTGSGLQAASVLAAQALCPSCSPALFRTLASVSKARGPPLRQRPCRAGAAVPNASQGPMATAPSATTPSASTASTGSLGMPPADPHVRQTPTFVSALAWRPVDACQGRAILAMGQGNGHLSLAALELSPEEGSSMQA